MVFQVSQESQHVRGIVFRYQRTSNRVVGYRVTGEQNDSMSQMDFVDTKRARKLAENRCPKRSTVKLSDRVPQAVVEKTSGQLKQEVTSDSTLNCGRIEFVDQDAVNDSLPYFVVVPSLRLDVFGGRAECLAARTLRSVLAIVDLPPEFLLKCYRPNPSNSSPLTPTKLSTFRARSLSRMARFSYCLGGCFLASMPGSFVLCPQKT